MSSLPNTNAAPGAERARWFLDEVQPHDGQLRAYLRGSFPTVRDVDDVVQESYLRIWRARAAHPIQSAKAFLFTIARRLALKTARRNRTVPIELVGDFGAIELLDQGPSPAEVLRYEEKVALLAEALTILPARCREIVILRKLQGLPQKAVAEQLGLSERTVENQLARGIKRCEAFFRARGIERFM